MEKVEEYRVEVDNIEEWIDGFEARLEALNIRDNQKKIKWCKAVIGSVGRGILKNADPTLSWDEIKTELLRYLGEEDSRAAAWRRLKHYKAGEKSLGEMAGDILSYARAAATEEDVQQRLAVDAFLEVVPWEIAREIKKKKMQTLRQALEEAKFLLALQEEEKKKEEQKQARVLAYEGQQPQMQRQQWRNIPMRQTPKIRCWACKEEGHIVRECPWWQEWCHWRQQENQQRRQPANLEQGGRTPERKVKLN